MAYLRPFGGGHIIKDHRGVNLISDALPFGRLWYAEPNAVASAVDYAKFRSRSHDAVIRVYDEAGNVTETPSTRAISQSGEFTLLIATQSPEVSFIAAAAISNATPITSTAQPHCS